MTYRMRANSAISPFGMQGTPNEEQDEDDSRITRIGAVTVLLALAAGVRRRTIEVPKRSEEPGARQTISAARGFLSIARYGALITGMPADERSQPMDPFPLRSGHDGSATHQPKSARSMRSAKTARSSLLLLSASRLM